MAARAIRYAATIGSRVASPQGKGGRIPPAARLWSHLAGPEVCGVTFARASVVEKATAAAARSITAGDTITLSRGASSSRPEIEIDFDALRAKVYDGRFRDRRIRAYARLALIKLRSEHIEIARGIADLQAGNEASKKIVISRVDGVINGILNDKYFPFVPKRRQLDELKALFIPIKRYYDDLVEELTKKERQEQQCKKNFLAACDAKKSQLLRNAQEEYDNDPNFRAYLKAIKERYSAENFPQSIYFAYAWPTDERHARESWVQPFLYRLQGQLTAAGFPVVMDIVSNRYGQNIYKFIKGAENSGYVLLFGTESLLDKHETGVRIVCSELIGIMKKREQDLNNNMTRVFPILLSGSHSRDAFPEEYERYITIRDWRDGDYLDQFQKLFLELWGYPPEQYQEELRREWKRISHGSQEVVTDWYKTQREAIDTARRTQDEGLLEKILVQRKSRLGERISLPALKERLRAHYVSQGTLSVFTLRPDDAWELSLPLESLYTKLFMIEGKKPQDPIAKGQVQQELYQQSIEPSEIFNTNKLRKAGRIRAVIYGSAGIGKTTYVSMLAHRWGKNELLTEFDTLFIVPLRNLTEAMFPNARKDYDAIDLIERLFKGLGIELRPLLEGSDVLQKSLLILDGWDELPVETRQGGHLESAFQELQEKFPHILITSRPGSVEMDTSAKFEIMGFGHTEIDSFISQFFPALNTAEDASRKIVGMKKILNQAHLVRSLARTPINLSMLCSLFDQDPTLLSSPESISVIFLYECLINQFFKIYLLRLGVSNEDLRLSRRGLTEHPKARKLNACLEKIAIEGAEQGDVYTDRERIQSILFSENLELADLRKLGLFRIDSDRGHFVHLTFQEYFAASYVSNQYQDPLRYDIAQQWVAKYRFWSKGRKSLDTAFFVVPLTAGILSERSPNLLQGFFDTLFKQPRDLTKIYELIATGLCFELCKDPSAFFQYEEEYIQRVVEMMRTHPCLSLMDVVFVRSRKLMRHPAVIREVQRQLHLEEEDSIGIYDILNVHAKSTRTLPSEVYDTLVTRIEEKKGDPRNAITCIEKVGGERGLRALMSIVLDINGNGKKVFYPSAVSAIGNIAVHQEIPRDIIQTFVAYILSNHRNQCNMDNAHLYTSAFYILEQIASRQKMPEDIVSTLITTIEDKSSDKEKRKHAMSILASIGSYQMIPFKAVEAFSSFIDDESNDDTDRCFAVYNLGLVASHRDFSEDVVLKVFEFIQNDNISLEARCQGALALKHVAHHQAIPEAALHAVLGLIQDMKASSEASSGAHVLQDIARYQQFSEDIQQAILGLYKKENKPNLVFPGAFAIESLLSLQAISDDAFLEIIALMKDGTTCADLRFRIALGLVTRFSYQEIPDEALQALKAFIQDETVVGCRRVEVACALGSVVSQKEILDTVISVLIALIDEFELLSSDSANIFGVIASHYEISEDRVSTLLDLIENEKKTLSARANAAQAVGSIASQQKIPENASKALLSLLQNTKTDRVKFCIAAEALASIANHQQIPDDAIHLFSSLFENGNDDDIRGIAIKNFGAIASHQIVSADILRALVSFIEDKKASEFIRLSVAEALGNVSDDNLTQVRDDHELITKICFFTRRALYFDGAELVMGLKLRYSRA